MKIRTILLMGAAAVAGIYLTSDEGREARKSIKKKKVVLMPVIKDLLKEANLILDGSKDIKSDEIRANIEKIVKEVKISLVNIDLEKAFEASKKAIKVASIKLNDVSNETNTLTRTSVKSKAVQSIKNKSDSTAKKNVRRTNEHN